MVVASPLQSSHGLSRHPPLTPSLLRPRFLTSWRPALRRISAPIYFSSLRPSLSVRSSYNDDDYRRRFQQQRRRVRQDVPFRVEVTERSLAEYALPAAALLAVAVVVGPALASLVFAALGVGVAVSVASAAFALSWAFLPFLLLGGGGLLFGGALMAGAFGATFWGGIILFNLLKFGALGAALWLGAKFAQSLFEGGQPASGSSSRSRGGGGSREPGPNNTIDVDAKTIDDDWTASERAAMRDFDDLLRRREEFKKGRDGLGR